MQQQQALTEKNHRFNLTNVPQRTKKTKSSPAR